MLSLKKILTLLPPERTAKMSIKSSRDFQSAPLSYHSLINQLKSIGLDCPLVGRRFFFFCLSYYLRLWVNFTTCPQHLHPLVSSSEEKLNQITHCSCCSHGLVFFKTIFPEAFPGVCLGYSRELSVLRVQYCWILKLWLSEFIQKTIPYRL